jgi:hypothetical protein
VNDQEEKERERIGTDNNTHNNKNCTCNIIKKGEKSIGKLKKKNPREVVVEGAGGG